MFQIVVSTTNIDMHGRGDKEVEDIVLKTIAIYHNNLAKPMSSSGLRVAKMMMMMIAIINVKKIFTHDAGRRASIHYI